MEFYSGSSVRLLGHKGRWMIHLVDQNYDLTEIVSVHCVPDKGCGEEDIDRSIFRNGCDLKIPYGIFLEIARKR